MVTLAIYLVQAPLNRGRESSPKGCIQGHTAREQLKRLLPFRDITQGQPSNRPCCFGGLWEQRDTVAYECQLNEPPRSF